LVIILLVIKKTYIRKNRENKQLSFTSDTKRSNLHLSESHRVVVAPPGTPVNAISGRRVTAIQIATVEVGKMTSVVPPRTCVPHCTWLVGLCVVVLVSSAELLSEVVAGQRVTFRQQTVC